MAFRHTLLNTGLLLIIIIILSTANFTKDNTELNYNVSNGTYFKPLHYDVKVRFDVYRNVFFGKCNISIEIHRPTKNITIRSSRIFGIIKIDLINNDNDRTPRKHPITVNIQKFSFINETNICLNFTQSSEDFLSPGTYILRMIYVRIILDDEDPVESYDADEEKILDNNGIKILRAKEFFPCWDEPEFKSFFNISIYHHKNYKVLSNMHIRQTNENIHTNMLWTHFDKSPLMSAQHLAIVIIKTVTLHTNIDSTANIEFWYRKEMTDQVQFAENVSQKVVYYLEQKSTKIVPKIHYIAIRNFQHSSVKMWGFIPLREENIIYNDTLDHIARKMEVANYIAHQTISYWYDDVFLWSKKGFITFLAAHILDQTKLIHRMMDLFVVQTQQESMRFDTLPNLTNSLPLPFHHKSSIIWRMLHHVISDTVFWTSIHIYIDRQYNESNTVQIDELWNIMQITLINSGNPYNLDIKYTLNTWITEKQPLQLYADRFYLYNVTIFSLHNNFEFDKNAEYLTLVTYTTKSKNYNYFWVDRQKPYWSFNEEFDKHDWIIVNLQQAGYYRIYYNTENWKNLAHYLYYENHTGIHVLNRAQIIDDAFYFFIQKRLDFITFWNITSFLLNDSDYIAWYPMIKAIEYMTCILAVQDTAVLKDKIQEMFYGLVLNIGYNSGSYWKNDHIKCLKEEAVKWACIIDAPACREIATIELKKNLQKSVQDKNLDQKEWIYCKGLMTANFSIWNDVYEKWKKTNDNTLLEYLTCSTNPYTNRNYLRLTKEDEFTNKVSNNNMCANIILLIVAKHAKNDIVLEFIFEQLEYIKLSSRKQVDQIAILIVIITHDHLIDKFEKINKFVKNKYLNDKRLVDAVKQKIEKRKEEYERKLKNYEAFI